MFINAFFILLKLDTITIIIVTIINIPLNYDIKKMIISLLGFYSLI